MPRSWGSFIATPTTLGLRVFVLMTPISLLAAAFAVPNSTADQILQRAGLGVIAQLVVGLVTAVGWPIAQRLRDSRPFILVWLAISYALRGVVLAAAFNLFALDDHLSPLLRVLGSMFTMSVWALVISTAVAAHDFYRRQLTISLSKAQDLERSASDGWSLEGSLSSDIEATRQRLTQVLDGPDQLDISEWASVVRRSIEEDLRPLSHRLWGLSVRGITRRERLRQFFWRVSNQSIPIMEVAIVLVVLTSWNAVLRYGVARGVLPAMTYSIILGALTLVLVKMRQRWAFTTRSQSFVELLAITLLAPAVVTAISAIWPTLPGEPLGIFALTLNGLFVVLFLVAIWATTEGSRNLAEQATSDVAALDLLIESRADARAKHLAEAARYLHNSVQSRFLRLQMHASSGQPTDQLATEVADARRILAELQIDRLPARGDALAELVAAVNSWSGIVDVAIAVADDFPTDHHLTPQLALFAQEAIANAVRHGQATSVRISLDRLDGEPVFTITDNGNWTGPEEMGQERHGPFLISVDRGDSTTTISARPLRPSEATANTTRQLPIQSPH